MNGYRILNAAGISARHGHSYRDAPLAAIGKNQPVALLKSLPGELKPAEPVIKEGVCPGKINGQFRPESA